MILGIGVDLCSVARISEALYRNSDANQLISDSAFCQRILSKEELLELSTTQHKENFVTKKWTAKEALCKASGNGMIIGFNNITIAHFYFFCLLESCQVFLDNSQKMAASSSFF